MEPKEQIDTRELADRRKRPWHKPELVEFGNVRELTRGSTGPRDEPSGKKPF